MRNLKVIIPSKTASNLGPCVEAVRHHEKDCDIIIIDDGIDWNAINANRAWTKAIKGAAVIKGTKPFIFARNCNLGIEAASDSDVILLNDDALLKSPGGFSLLQKAVEDHPEYGCIGATTNVTGQPLQKQIGNGLRHLTHIAFICVLIPRRTINQIGMLDEQYCIDYGVEDRDYCEMINRAGLLVGVHDGCFVDHDSLQSSYRGHPRKPRSSEMNRLLFLKKFNLRSYWGY